MQPPTPQSAPDAKLLSPHYPYLTRCVVTNIALLLCGNTCTAPSFLELVLLSAQTMPESALLESLCWSISTSYDRTSNARYDLISVLHKSVRCRQAGAALYWLVRMLEAGKDPIYIAWWMTVCVSEDIGIADGAALSKCP